jgi:hypothetical protein
VAMVPADDAAVLVADPSLASAATAALASIRLQLGTAEHHLRQALERGARLRDRMARAGGDAPQPGSVIDTFEYPALAEAEASIERARAALGALAGQPSIECLEVEASRLAAGGPTSLSRSER